MLRMVIKILSIVVLMALSSVAQALVILQQVSVPSSVEFETNPDYVKRDEESLWRYTTTPAYTISAVEGVNKWLGSAALRLQRSSDKKRSIDREDPLLSLGWERELEKGSFKMLGSYEKSSIRATEFRRTGVVNSDGDSMTKSIGAEWTRLLTDRLKFTLGGRILDTEYSTGSLVDFSTQSIDSTLAYQINERINAFAILGHYKFKPDDGTGDDAVIRYLAGANIQLSPRLSFTGAAGWNKISSVGYSTIGNASISYELGNHTFQGTFERTTGATGSSNLQKSDALAFIYGYALTNKSKLGSNATWFKSDDANEVLGLGGFYQKDISERWQMKLSLDMRTLKDNIKTVNSEIAGIYFTFNTPEF